MKAECYLLFPFMATLLNVIFVAIIQHSRVAHAMMGQQQEDDGLHELQ